MFQSPFVLLRSGHRWFFQISVKRGIKFQSPFVLLRSGHKSKCTELALAIERFQSPFVLLRSGHNPVTQEEYVFDNVSIPFCITTVGSLMMTKKSFKRCLKSFNPLLYYYSRVICTTTCNCRMYMQFQSPITSLQSGHKLEKGTTVFRGKCEFQSPITSLQSGH